MASFRVEGGYKLSGQITPQGAKNEALQVICATLLTEDEVIISNIPDILAVNNLINLLSSLLLLNAITLIVCLPFLVYPSFAMYFILCSAR